jgi:hypothetical protein
MKTWFLGGLAVVGVAGTTYVLRPTPAIAPVVDPAPVVVPSLDVDATLIPPPVVNVTNIDALLDPPQIPVAAGEFTPTPVTVDVPDEHVRRPFVAIPTAIPPARD